MPLILSAGRNDELLSLRSSVLQTIGTPVVAARSAKEIKTLLMKGATFDVVVLCHTFSEEEARQIAATVKAASLKARVCVLYTTTIPAQTPLFDVRLDSQDGPDALVDCVKRMLAA